MTTRGRCARSRSGAADRKSARGATRGTTRSSCATATAGLVFLTVVALAALLAVPAGVVAVLAAAPATANPDSLRLDVLANRYVPVQFAHQAHTHWDPSGLVCGRCHHTTSAGETPSGCRACHPLPDPAQPPAQLGLKGAYHGSCLACHLSWDVRTRCEVCHARQAPGATPHAGQREFYDPLEPREEIIFLTELEEGDAVHFTHAWHARECDPSCSECHREQRCAGCHARGEPGYPLGRPGERDLHETCSRCHDAEACADCHSSQ